MRFGSFRLKKALLVFIGMYSASSRAQCGATTASALDSGFKALVYDATTGVTTWYSPGAAAVPVGPGYSPVAFTKDRVMVIVCGLRFDSAVNVVSTPVAVPEKGADIRGASPTTTTSNFPNSATTDALQAVATNTNTALEATLPGSGTAATLVKNDLITLGSVGKGAYTPAAISATAEDFRRAILTYQHQAVAAQEAIRAFCRDQSNPCTSVSALDAPPGPYPFGTAFNLYHRATTLQGQIAGWAVAANYGNTGMFDQAKATTNQFIDLLSAFDSRVTASKLGSQVAGLAATYQTLAGSLVTVNEIEQADLNGLPSPNCAVFAPVIPATPTLQEQRFQEWCLLEQFKAQVNAPPYVLTPGGDIPGVISPTALFDELRILRSNLKAINSELELSFSALNQWHDNSAVIYTDFLTPSTTNLGLRIGVNVSDLYVPFTLGSSLNASNTVPNTAAGHFASNTELLIERRTHFNFTGGFLTIHIPTHSYALVGSTISTPTAGTAFTPCPGSSTVTVPSSGTAPTYYCPVVTNSTEWQVAAIAALNYLPFGRNYFPTSHRYHDPKTYRDMFGLMLGTSVTSLGSGFGGISFEPTNGINFYAGVASGHSQRLAAGTGTHGDIYESSTATTISTLHAGLAVGIGFDFTVFSQIFKNGAIGPSAP